MPKIELKPRSAEFADDQAPPRARSCDMPGCATEGSHKAPRDRGLKDYYWFCLDHVQEYNNAWNYFSGMSQRDIEEHIVRSALWDRPTRRYDARAQLEEQLYRTAWQTYNYTAEEPSKGAENPRSSSLLAGTPEFEAMAIMGLEPPLNRDKIKLRYKELVKKHHPDVNGGCPKSEELLKSINMAYTILKLASEKFETLPARDD